MKQKNTKKNNLKKMLNVKRLTRQRTVVFNLLSENKDKHLHVKELYKLARKSVPEINLSTIYRTIKELKQAKLVEELHLGEEHHHYELKKSRKHQHLLCTECSRITEFKTTALEKLCQEIKRRYNFSPHDIQVDITGVCSRCMDIEKNKKS